MLGATASGLYWMFRQLERSENNARLLEAGLRIALTRSTTAGDGWESVIRTAGVADTYRNTHGAIDGDRVIDFVLRDRRNPSSVRSLVESARDNGRRVRTALTREVWEAVNSSAMTLRGLLAEPVNSNALPAVLEQIRRETAYVRGAHQGTTLRAEGFNFARLGTFIERSDNTARVLDVKYYVLLSSPAHVGSVIDNLQWESILRSVSAQRAYRWARHDEPTAAGIAEFLILDPRMPRSLHFCARKVKDNLGYLADAYGTPRPCHDLADEFVRRFDHHDITPVFAAGLHEFLAGSINAAAQLGAQIEHDYRFTE